MDLVPDVYSLVRKLPEVERFALADQMRRAAVSVPSNIAEGAARQTRKEFVNFLHIAQGSLSELDTQLELSVRLGYIPDSLLVQTRKAMGDVDRMLSGLIRSLRVPKA
jgi:four helix bundle protein